MSSEEIESKKEVSEQRTGTMELLIEESLPTRLHQIHQLMGELTSSPASHDIIELAMATVTSLAISQEDGTPLVWLIVVGPPGSDKTQTVLSLQGCENTEFLDTLTPASFVTGYINDKTGEKAQDLLPLLNGRCLIIKDLTTLFSMRAEKVQQILGDLQSIYDGSYSKATGTVGVIRHDSCFVILACITPEALKKHQHYMSAVGGRFLLYQIPDLTEAGIGRRSPGSSAARPPYSRIEWISERVSGISESLGP